MAKRTTYGKTWWGQQWLNALQQIDYSNRLPRGRTYANKGAVKDIAIKNEQITAKVQGSSYEPYKQKIAVKPFSVAEKQIITELVTGNPVLLSALLNKELPTELNKLLEEKGIRLFPRSWDDMTATCSCPDWAVPCKHLAAVIYLIANEIDRNPFLVFELHGFDLLKEVQQSGFSSAQKSISLPSLYDAYTEDFSETEEPLNEALLGKIDFSVLPESSANLLKLLDSNPLFFESADFIAILKRYYKEMRMAARKRIDAEKTPAFTVLEEELALATVYLDETLSYVNTIIETDENTTYLTLPQRMDRLIELLDQMQASHWHSYHSSIVALYWVHQTSLQLALKGAFLPELVQLEKGTFAIRWIPALIVPEVRQLVATLQEMMPEGMVGIEAGDRYWFPKEKSEAVKMLISAFLNHWIGSIYDYKNADYSHEAVFNLFFRQEPFQPEGFFQQEIPHAIQKWLQKFFISEKPFVPVLKVEDTDGGFDLSLHIQEKAETLKAPFPLKDLFEKKKHAAIRIEMLQDFGTLTQYVPVLQQVISSKGKQRVTVDPEAFTQLFLESLPILQLLNIQVLFPKALERLTRPQLSGRIQTQGSSGASGEFVNLQNMLNFDWQVAMGDRLISPDEFRKAIKGLKGIVKINDEFVLVDQKEMERILKKLDKPPTLKPQEVLQAALSQNYVGARVELSQKAQQLIDQVLKIDAVETPASLQATLRPYQQRGFEWMYKNARIGFGSLLADDMGLGKTIQLITLLLKLKEEDKLAKKKALIILPTTLLGNWEREIKKFGPSLETILYHGTKRKAVWEKELEGAEVILTSYGTARRDASLLQGIQWGLLAIDEAQNIKNTGTEQTKAIKKIKSDSVVALSGTPVENRLSEYWSIFDFTNKGYLYGITKFKQEFIKPIEIERDQEALQRFRSVTAPFILRRVKTDKSIISDLPEKIETNQLCTLTKEQAALYKNITDTILKELQSQEGTQRTGLVFQLMNALKQICNHPSHYLKKKDMKAEHSGKAQMLLSLLDTIYENGEKTLIFTQYKEMGDLLVNLIQERYHTEPLWLHGGVSRKKRDLMVEDFQTKPYLPFMLLSLKAGGTGLNLTAANNVIHYDLWWNPAVESQATDRAFRIGQQKNVLVHRFITQGTFEEKINEMIQSKKELADLTVSSGENWIGNLSNAELKTIFEL